MSLDAWMKEVRERLNTPYVETFLFNGPSDLDPDFNEGWVYYNVKTDKIHVYAFEPINMRILWPEVMPYTVYLGVL